MDDKQLQLDVMDELEFEPRIDAAHIGVTAHDGVVTLTGYVFTYADKVTAENAARRVKGVRGLASEIEVRYPGGAKTSDDEIARRVLDMLKWTVTIPDDAVQVTVRNGLVTLTGELSWQYQRQAAEEAVERMDGVSGVVNAITIKPALLVPDIKKKIEDALKRHAEVEARAIRVMVQDGRVSLEGTVDNWDERQAVENAAWSVAGVKSVDDRLIIGRSAAGYDEY
jgi:osmotically-inducible protein OsmY